MGDESSYVMMNRMRGKGALGVAAVVLALLFGGWFLLWGQAEDSTDRDASTKASNFSFRRWEEQIVGRGVRELSDRRVRRLQPLGVPFGKPEGMPVEMRRAVRESLGPVPFLRLDFDQAQYVSTPLGIGLWIVEGRGVTCMFRDKQSTSTCDTSANARRLGLLLQVYRLPPGSPHGRPTDFLTMGVAPGWTKAVALKIGRASKTVPVIDGAYALRAERPIRFQRLVR